MIRFLARAARRFVISAVLLLAVWLAGYGWFLSRIPSHPSRDESVTDAIVVLTGGKGRIDYGVGLLAEGKARRMFISGVGEEASPEPVVMRNVEAARKKLGVPEESVVTLGYDATSTIGNAAETARWVEKEGFSSLRLVTASYHMPRALEELRYALPYVRIIADPYIPEGFDKSQWWRLGRATAVTMVEYHKFIAARVRHALLEWEKA